MKKGEVKRFLKAAGIPSHDGLDFPVYVFASLKTEHIYTAIKRSCWAIADIKKSQLQQRKTKAAKLPVGGLGLFYSSEGKFFTTPFQILSKPRDVLETSIWPGEWHFPFDIKTFGDLGKRLYLSKAKNEWDAFKHSKTTGEALNLSGAMAFVESWLSRDDWRSICKVLVADEESLKTCVNIEV